MAEVKLNYERMNIDDIYNWCEENNQLDWLENELSKTVKVKRYSERKQKLDRNGNPVYNKKGYPIYIADKSSEVIETTQSISFMQLRKNFIARFELEDIKPEKKTKPLSMLEKVRARRAQLGK